MLTDRHLFGSYVVKERPRPRVRRALGLHALLAGRGEVVTLLDLLGRYRGAVQALAAIMAVNPLGFVSVPAFRADEFFRWLCGRCHAADSFFGLVGDGADGVAFSVGFFDSFPPEDFSVAALAGGASFLADS